MGHTITEEQQGYRMQSITIFSLGQVVLLREVAAHAKRDARKGHVDA